MRHGEAGGLMQEVDGFGRARAGGPDRFIVRAQHRCPIRDILGMLQSSGDLQLGAEEGRCEFGDEFLEGVGTIAEAFAELPREPRLGAAPVRMLVTRRRVKCGDGLELLRSRKGYRVGRG
jgi:hypothetical protein